MLSATSSPVVPAGNEWTESSGNVSSIESATRFAPLKLGLTPQIRAEQRDLKVMDAAGIARNLSGDGRILEVGSGVGRLYRIWEESGETRLVKIYPTPAAERREQQAFESLAPTVGLPTITERGQDEGTHWAVFEDPGKWNLASLPENSSLGRKAGAILAELHGHSIGRLSNVAHGIDQEWINADFPAVFKRLDRYRGRLQLGSEVVEQASRITPPEATGPVIIHTDPSPELFFVNDDGDLTLFHWEWSTLGPPEWDYSRLLWLTRLKVGPEAAAGIIEGYGGEIPAKQLERWAVYHSGMMLIQAVEVVDPQLRGAEWLVEELARAVAAAK